MPEPEPPRRTRAKARRGGGMKALAGALSRVTARAFGRRGLAEAGLVADWPAIVGAELAHVLLPRGLAFPKRGERRDGTLTLRVEPGFATAVQHLEPMVIERINGYLGYPAVGRLRLQHGPLSANRPMPAKTAPEPPAEATRALDARLGQIDDPELAAALARLGRALISSELQSKQK